MDSPPDLGVPAVQIAPRRCHGAVGHFLSEQAFAHFLGIYRHGMALLPPYAELRDIETSFGTVRVYRFAAVSQDRPSAPPVLLLPGRNASTPMYRTNLPSLLARRTVYSLDLLGEPGLSVQRAPITGPADNARWLDETLAGLGLDAVHLLGVSIGGWATVNYAARYPARAASLALLDPVMTFDGIPVKTLVASLGMTVPGVPKVVRRRILRWISGGADVSEAVPEAQLIAAGTNDFALHLPAPTPITDEQLGDLSMPVLALLAGRSVMLHAERAAARGRMLLPQGQIEVWPEASHAINGEFPDRIAQRAHTFWDEADAD